MQILVRAAISSSLLRLNNNLPIGYSTFFRVLSYYFFIFLARDIFLRISNTRSLLFIYWTFIFDSFLQFHLTSSRPHNIFRFKIKKSRHSTQVRDNTTCYFSASLLMESAILNVRTFQNKRSIFRPKTSVALSACAFPVLIIIVLLLFIPY